MVLADRVFAEAVELFVGLVERAAFAQAEGYDGIAAALAVKIVCACCLEKATCFLQGEGHGEGDLQHLVARWVALAGEDLVAERFVESGVSYDVRPLEVFDIEQVSEVL